jgi:serine/threonine-protein kinase
MMGRYALFREIAAGGMAVVHLGRLQGPVGFSRTVAIKRLYPQYARDPEFVSMFLDEARLAARIRHPNVAPTLDVVASAGELFLVMEYVHGDSLARLLRQAQDRRERIPPRVILSIAAGALSGLHSAHEARGARGEPLGIVHRDISPQNILVGVDGSPRIVDFGVAKAAGRVQTTRDGQLKGKIGYFAPEQISGTVTRKTDIFAMSIVLWEALAGRRLFRGENDATTLYNLLHAPIAPPSTFAPEIPPGIDAAVLRGLERDPSKRFESAREMALELERHMQLASPNDVGAWVERLAHESLTKRAGFVAEVEGSGPELPEDSVARIMSPGSEPPATLEGEDETRSDSSVSAKLLPAVLAAPPASRRGPDGEPITGDAAHASRPPPAESTSLSVATSMNQIGQISRSRPTPWIWIGGGVVTLLLLVGIVSLTASPKQPKTDANPSVPPASAAAEPAQPPAKDSAPATSSSTEPPASASASSARAPVNPAPATPPKTPAIIRKPPPTPPPQTTSRPANTPNPHCAVPYTLDATGRKKWKPECL